MTENARNEKQRPTMKDVSHTAPNDVDASAVWKRGRTDEVEEE